jgi:threonine aldolase
MGTLIPPFLSLSLIVSSFLLTQMNAVVASGIEAKRMLQHVDSVSLCLSKGLGAPCGGVVAGTEDFIYRARRARKMLGGGMRQSGILAAAGIYALDHHVERMAVDHKNAQKLAWEISKLDGFLCNEPQTNIVLVDVDDKVINMDKLVNRLMEVNINLSGSYNSKGIRLVTHLDINEEDVDRVVNEIRRLVEWGLVSNQA